MLQYSIAPVIFDWSHYIYQAVLKRHIHYAEMHLQVCLLLIFFVSAAILKPVLGTNNGLVSLSDKLFIPPMQLSCPTVIEKLIDVCVKKTTTVAR